MADYVGVAGGVCGGSPADSGSVADCSGVADWGDVAGGGCGRSPVDSGGVAGFCSVVERCGGSQKQVWF